MIIYIQIIYELLVRFLTCFGGQYLIYLQVAAPGGSSQINREMAPHRPSSRVAQGVAERLQCSTCRPQNTPVRCDRALYVVTGVVLKLNV